ncbi:MAG: sensor histidine kinase [Bacteroidetes bacterium]|nr:sensor histidine kinase [Bacteroidota bacterium]
MAVFRARARTLEMLGKQQIAGIPTAINELFKNAHDAYADRVEVDYFRSNKLFMLRDDGIGMAKEDFENRWLTIGTESKLEKKGRPKDPKKYERPILGEKGIGRLAIASIGPQVLVLTRPKYGKDKNLTAAFINWTLFELPGVDLDEIIIPLKSYRIGEFPDAQDVKKMIGEVKKNIFTLLEKGKVDEIKQKEILTQLELFNVDPIYWEEIYTDLTLLNNKCGTHYFIQPTDEMLEVELDTVNTIISKTSALQRLLIGFTNTMIKSNPPIKTAFRDHKAHETFEDLIGEKEFFTKSDFKKVDHHIKGEFNEFGQFNGTVQIYDNEPLRYVLPWEQGGGKKTSCGRFKINFAYVQPEPRTTHLSNLDHLYIRGKLNKHAGLYIYKDGIRILPYGNSDFDFLDIEKRRTLKASYYFFSYRNMFGAIEIDGEVNKKLKEKAGREGFIENKAYKDFKDVLIYFLIQVAADYFRQEGTQSDIFLKQRAEYERLHVARKKRAEDLHKQTNIIERKLDKFFTNIKENAPQKEINLLYEKTRDRFEQLIKNNILKKSSKYFLDAELLSREDLDKIRNTYTINRPKGYAIGKDLRYDWELYLEAHANLEEKIFFPAQKELEKIANQFLTKYKVQVAIQDRLNQSLSYTFDKLTETLENENKQTKTTLSNVSNQIADLTKNLLYDLENKINEAREKYSELMKSDIDDSKLSREARKIEGKLFEEAQKTSEVFQKLRSQLDKLILGKSKSGNYITSADVSEAMEEELLSLRERVDTDLALSQLGLAVGVIHHEFNHSVRLMRENIKRLKLWAEKNQKLQEIYENIRNNFEHLDGYLTLFTPLNRRLYRKKVDIYGKDIKNFILDIFSERLRRHNIDLSSSKQFNQKVIQGFPSTFYPVFVNIIDNAIFWLGQRKGERFIIFDADEKGFSIENNGSEINKRDVYRIFEMGFSRKPMGRGMGLAISKEVLEKEGYKIFVDSLGKGLNVKFRIELDPSRKIEEE